MSFVTERVIFLQPPDALLAYDYFRMKSLKCLNTLAKICEFDQIKEWEEMITDHIVVVRDVSAYVVKYLQEIFHGEITVQACQTNIFKRSEVVYESAAERFPSKGTLDSTLVFLIVETERNDGKIGLTDKAEEILLALRQRYTVAEMKKFRIFAPSVDVPSDRHELTEVVKDVLKFGQNDVLEVQSTSFAKEETFSLVNRHSTRNIERIVNSMKEIMIRLQSSAETSTNAWYGEIPKKTIVKGIQTAIESFSALKRIMSKETKENLVTPELQETFDTMKNFGYAGHVYINKTLSIYVRENCDEKTKEKLMRAAANFFDRITCSPLSDKETIRQFTNSLKHDQGVENQNGRKGRIGAFARQNNNVVALTVPHLATSGQMIRKDDSVIGTCVWPPSQPHYVLMNKISLIEINAEWQNVCHLMHENLNGDMRPFTLHLSKPILYTKVYKGRLNTGFITGRIISNEAKLPLGDGTINAYLVEGDNELPFVNTGDSGVVVKLQQEVGGHLHGLSMVFGGTLSLPDIEPDTCITIPLAAAVDDFEKENETHLFFR